MKSRLPCVLEGTFDAITAHIHSRLGAVRRTESGVSGGIGAGARNWLKRPGFRLIDEHVDLPPAQVKFGVVNPAGKLASIIAAMTMSASRTATRTRAEHLNVSASHIAGVQLPLRRKLLPAAG